jgi:hypothetical protein
LTGMGRRGRGKLVSRIRSSVIPDLGFTKTLCGYVSGRSVFKAGKRIKNIIFEPTKQSVLRALGGELGFAKLDYIWGNRRPSEHCYPLKTHQHGRSTKS